MNCNGEVLKLKSYYDCNAIVHFPTLGVHAMPKNIDSISPPKWYRLPNFRDLAHGLVGLLQALDFVSKIGFCSTSRHFDLWALQHFRDNWLLGCWSYNQTIMIPQLRIFKSFKCCSTLGLSVKQKQQTCEQIEFSYRITKLGNDF